MPRHSPLILSVLISVVVLFPLFSQRSAGGAHAIEKTLSEGDFKRADSLFTYDVAHFASTGNLDTLITYIPLAGKIGNKDAGPVQAKKKVYELINLLTHHDASGHQLLEAYEDAGEFFGSIGQDQYGYDANKEALEIAMSIPKLSPLRIARCEYNLGTYAQRLGNLGLSQKHGRNAMAIRQHQPDTPPEDMYLSANAMGALMWFGSRYDSAAIFFKQALAELEKATPNDLNRYFRPANVWNNMAAIYSVEGNTTEAIHAMEMTIVNFQKYLEGEDPKAKRVSATEGLFQAIDNLAGIYREIGDYGKGGDLLRYSYQRKLQTFEAGNPGIFISEILLGQHYQGLYEYDSASYYLKAGLEKLEQSEGGYLFWAADAYYNLAMIAENKNDNAQAAIFYKKSEALYEESYQGDYDNIYMGFLRSASVFYAKNNDYPAAIERAEKVYNYVVSIGENASLQAFYQLLNIAEINFLTHRYKEAVNYSNNALSTLRSKMQGGFTMLDSIKMEVFKPKALLINAKSSYFLKTNRDSSFLTELSTRMAEASEILQKRKVFIDDASSINILMKDHQELLDFSKQLQLELFEKTGNASYLDALVNLHESALYSRIRARLDKQRAIRFTQLPDSVQQQEDSLKSAITASLQIGIPETEQIAGYLAASNRWEAYLAMLKLKYPSYYNMRYATLYRPISELQAELSDSTTLIRYLYCDNRLMALIVDKSQKQLVLLNSDSLDQNISKILTVIDEKTQLPLLHDLYKKVWEPLARKIKTKRIVIIPDGNLYNLSFEMLAEASLKTYNELASKSLLSRHSISYHYSLFMLNQSEVLQNLRSNYVGFTPGFSDELKERYMSVVKDSIKIDQRYLKLLPQPGITKLAEKIKGLLGGDIFMDEGSTQSSFRKNAGGHNIIHIGTHAEYNNVHPEQSGLLFSKNIAEANENNFLTLYDVYNCDMRSNLTLLTACESGRHGYQDGEGMISLAHAFNYAGSQRILTALWKIDEQSSSQITESLITNLKDGMDTDEALRQAKLKYIREARGRTVAPAYWAGLVIMGEPAHIAFHDQAVNRWWVFLAIAAALVLLIMLMKYFSRASA